MSIKFIAPCLPIFFAAAAAAAPVAIQNPSFETDVLPRDGNTATVGNTTDDFNTDIVPTGWIGFDDGLGGTGGNRGLVSHAVDSFFNSSLTNTPDADANDQSFFTAARDIYQNLGDTLQANTTYTLTIDIGDRGPGSTGGLASGTPAVSLGYGAATGTNNVLVLNQATQPAQVDSGWVEWSAQFTTGASPAGLGEALRIELTNGTNVGWFDNVRLDAVVDLAPGIDFYISAVGAEILFEWSNSDGKVYDLRYDDGGLGTVAMEDWPIYLGSEGIASAYPQNNSLLLPRPPGPRGFFFVTEREPNVVSGPVKVFLLAGQSNMLGSGTVVSDLPAALQGAQADILFIHQNVTSLTNLQPGSGLQYGPEITFGRSVANANPTDSFALIKYANSATDLENNWDPATGLSHSNFVAKVTQGMAALTAAGYTPEIVGMLWTQGERDAREGFGITYEGNLNELIADVRTRYGAGLPFFISQLSSGQTNLPPTGLAAVRAAQAAVAVADANSYLIVTDSFGLRTDDLHFSSAGQISLGEAFADAHALSGFP